MNERTLLLIVALPLLALWARVILEVLRRDDLTTVQTVIWIVGLVFVPVLALAAYIVVRVPPKNRVSDASANTSRAEQLVLLAERRQRGDLVGDDYRLALAGLEQQRGLPSASGRSTERSTHDHES